MGLILEKPLNPGELNMKTKSKKIVMSAKWNGLHMATYLASILTSIGTMTVLVSMEKPPGSFIVTNHFSRMKHGNTRVSKASPINWLRDFLENYAPACSGKYVFMDQGGELCNNPEVRKLFTRFGYEIRPTGADASNQNAPVERGHLVVANAIRALLLGANLPIKFWPYAFHFWLCIDNSMASQDQLVSPNYIATGKKDDLAALHTFGCRVWVHPPGRQSAKLIPNSCKGIFLGFIPNTNKNIIWYDIETHVVKIAKHVRFDEGMNDLPPDLVPPNVVHLQRTQNGEPLPAEVEETSVDQFTFHLNLFSYTMAKGVQVTDDDPSYRLTLASDELSHRAYVTDVKENSTADQMCATHKSTLKNVKGAYLVGINGKKVFGKDDAISMLHQLYDERAENQQLKLAIKRKLSSAETGRTVAEHNIMEPSAVPDVDHHHQLTLADVRCISIICYPHLDFSESSISTEEMEMVIQAIQLQAIAPAEQAIGRFTRRKLCSLSTWEQWRAGEHKQLDHFHDLKMYGEPVRKLPGAIVLRPHCSVPLNGMVQGALTTAAMVPPDLHPYYTTLLQHTPHELNNQCSNFSLPSLYETITESMAVSYTHLTLPTNREV